MVKTDSADPIGTVLNIQHFCSHDGPGIRTTVFLKGCSLRCKWCSNPESILPKPELAYNPSKCIGEKQCGICLKAPFPEGAMFVIGGREDKVHVNWDLASDCDEKTVGLCPTGALHMFGQKMTVDEVLDEVEQDSAFYRESGGGMTLSGGECLLQPDFCAALLAKARKRGIHTAIETAGNVPWRFVEKVLAHVDLVLHDRKLTDPQAHKKWTGADNVLLVSNFEKAYAEFTHTQFVARTPVIPGVNDNGDHIRAVLDSIRPYKNVIDYELLPYHRYGENKYGFLGKVYALHDFQSPSPDVMKRLHAIIDEAFGRSSPSAQKPA